MVITDPGFYQKLLEVSSEVQMKPEDLLNVMAVESGIDPTAHNPNGDASGLIQFMPDTLKGLGYQGTHVDFRRMSSIDQLDYVKKYILGNMKYNGGPFTSAAQYYVANFLPVALKLPGIQEGDPNTIIAAKNPKEPHLPNVSTHRESIYYNANPSLDADRDGVITYGDIQTVLNRATAGKNFRNAIARLQNSTGYKPSGGAPASMLATNKISPNNDIMAVLNTYLSQIAASERSNKKLYKKYLPKHQFVIRIGAPTYTSATEFSRVLASALDEELLADAFVHTDGQQVDVECCIHGPKDDCFKTVQQLTNSVAEVFEIATKKIGGINIETQFFMNKRSSYHPITIEASNYQHRKFLLKFI
jgi:hypothetical protein